MYQRYKNAIAVFSWFKKRNIIFRLTFVLLLLNFLDLLTTYIDLHFFHGIELNPRALNPLWLSVIVKFGFPLLMGIGSYYILKKAEGKARLVCYGIFVVSIVFYTTVVANNLIRIVLAMLK
jgi:hypothetical protein